MCINEDPRFGVTNEDLDERDRKEQSNNRCPSCGLKWQYLSGQRYCPTCEADYYYPDPER